MLSLETIHIQQRHHFSIAGIVLAEIIKRIAMIIQVNEILIQSIVAIVVAVHVNGILCKQGCTVFVLSLLRISGMRISVQWF